MGEGGGGARPRREDLPGPDRKCVQKTIQHTHVDIRISGHMAGRDL